MPDHAGERVLDLVACLDDELPISDQPFPSPRCIRDSERLHNLQHIPENAQTANTEALCHAGNVVDAKAAVTALLEDPANNVAPERLEFCLLGAIVAGNVELVKWLLDAGVPAGVSNAKAAIRKKSAPMLSLFVQHGLRINEPESPMHPPLLA